jgi:hypothetical protein
MELSRTERPRDVAKNPQALSRFQGEPRPPRFWPRLEFVADGVVGVEVRHCPCRIITEKGEAPAGLPRLRSEKKNLYSRRSYLLAPILVTPPPSFVTQTLLPSNATISGLKPTG